jgi:hypothetical protein
MFRKELVVSQVIPNLNFDGDTYKNDIACKNNLRNSIQITDAETKVYK